MSNREYAHQLLDKIPENKITYIVGILEGAAIPKIEEVEQAKREKAQQLLNSVPDYKMQYVIAYLQGITAGENIQNDKTLAAMKEL